MLDLKTKTMVVESCFAEVSDGHYIFYTNQLDFIIPPLLMASGSLAHKGSRSNYC